MSRPPGPDRKMSSADLAMSGGGGGLGLGSKMFLAAGRPTRNQGRANLERGQPALEVRPS